MSGDRSTRRDRRYVLRSGSGWVTYADPLGAGALRRATLTRISVAGLAFELEEAAPDLEPGTILSNATVRIGPSEIRGEILVKNLTSRERGGRVGGLFYPAGAEAENLLMTLISGVEAGSV